MEHCNVQAARRLSSSTGEWSASAMAMLAAFAPSLRGTFAVFGKIAPAAALMAAPDRAGLMAAMALFAAFASGLGRQLMVLRETPFLAGNALATLAPGFCGALAIILEVSAAGLATLAGNFPLSLFVHRCEASVRSRRLITIWHLVNSLSRFSRATRPSASPLEPSTADSACMVPANRWEIQKRYCRFLKKMTFNS
jgi:hypothetical protein